MNVIEGGGAPVPDWPSLFDDVLDVAAAGGHWRRIISELKTRELLAEVNAHAVQRLVLAYVIYDRAAREVASTGAVLKPKRGNPKSIARVSPHFTVLREAASDAAQIEAELGLAPRRRSAATKADNGKKAPRAADRFLRPVS
ncbi:MULTISPECIES: P27 family phage terminase small subunit [unclassified Bosea (in: a-proteobacteria)]|uniref:P27 family phage terminase small subunit n=1 Tax=unclassified Bosea (in: a-proteobacteria) TaxID=2653178 RepID=UPI000F7641E3|nr:MULTISPECIES: P27 family phage terminase small subunit [unclassified Bosea (in: a-proteobacteria)]AZO77496.1 hypothetical protein BLM15_07620 [Bosea sp. Tri-49]RXT18100.1 hypothetical protein B5U98_22770 [Bosea sp. Tri-39]RXT32698.1 hypothetical protein B5U99_29115 [Bosea sp. Tri-54]